MTIEALTDPVDEARRSLAVALITEREHFAEVAQQALVAHAVGDFDAGHALTRVIVIQACGGYDDDYPAVWTLLKGGKS